jgi:hypothetical protein
MMDWTPLEHLGITLCFVMLGYLLADHAGVLVGTALGSGIFLGRGHAQNEQRTIHNYYLNQRDLAPWWCGFDRRSIDVGSVLDVACPVVGGGVVAYCLLLWF